LTGIGHRGINSIALWHNIEVRHLSGHNCLGCYLPNRRHSTRKRNQPSAHKLKYYRVSWLLDSGPRLTIALVRQLTARKDSQLVRDYCQHTLKHGF
jgi:hypothetical protein